MIENKEISITTFSNNVVNSTLRKMHVEARIGEKAVAWAMIDASGVRNVNCEFAKGLEAARLTHKAYGQVIEAAEKVHAAWAEHEEHDREFLAKQ